MVCGMWHASGPQTLVEENAEFRVRAFVPVMITLQLVRWTAGFPISSR
jgi:hypothetical protein